MMSQLFRQQQLFIATFGHGQSFVMIMTKGLLYTATNEASPYTAAAGCCRCCRCCVVAFVDADFMFLPQL